MPMIARQAGPRIVERGVSLSLDMPVYDQSGTAQTATVATVKITDGSDVVVDTVVATSLGPPAAYTLDGSVSQARDMSEKWLEVWSLTIGGVPYTFRRAAYLVRHAFHPMITDTDLTARHSDLLTLLPSTVTDLGTYRQAAAEKIERELIKKGRRPHLIFDSWALLDAERALSLHYVFADFASAIGDGRYKELAASYLAEFHAELDSCKFSYDNRQTGTVDTTIHEGATPMVVITAGPATRRLRGFGARARW